MLRQASPALARWRVSGSEEVLIGGGGAQAVSPPQKKEWDKATRGRPLALPVSCVRAAHLCSEGAPGHQHCRGSEAHVCC
eukprot:5859600-Pleurochrysis_carterae.AAC.2